MSKEIGITKEIAAEELFKEFKEHSIAEFFRKNRQMLGLYGKIRTLTTIVHELVTNSLDACEESGILPEIKVRLQELGSEHYSLEVQDNGPGIPKEKVGKALGQLLAGTKFHRLIQQRGQQGIGVSGCIMFSQMTTGKPVYVETGTKKGKPITLFINIDTKENKPKISELKEMKKEFKGTKIKLELKEVLYRKGEQGILEYLRRTAIANPHAEITFIAPDKEKTKYNRVRKDIPKRSIEVKPHPKGITIDELLTISKSTNARKTDTFLLNEFDRMGNKAIKEIQKIVKFDLKKDPKKLVWEEAEQLIKAFKKINFIAPRTDILRPIGQKRLEQSLKNILKPEFFSVITRKPSVYQGYPFQIEVAICFGGNSGKEIQLKEGGTGKGSEIMRFANLTPLLFESGACAISKAVKSVDWKRYDIRDIEKTAITVLINMVSVHIPYTGAGKTAISDVDEVFEEMRLALMDSGRKVGTHIKKMLKEKEKQEKKQVFLRYIPEVINALTSITKEDPEKLEKKLTETVLHRLKIEEMQEKEEELIEEKNEQEIEEE